MRDVVGNLRLGRPCRAQDLDHVCNRFSALFASVGRMVEQDGEIVAMDRSRGNQQLSTDLPDYAACGFTVTQCTGQVAPHRLPDRQSGVPRAQDSELVGAGQACGDGGGQRRSRGGTRFHEREFSAKKDAL
ncbi:hypothetical protein [Paraburkholderia panacisoli]|uniref:hypothetical protein n=1 Tax=Paraburkholderia panacisoli TaxID=2603818 RepID=UPI00165F4E9E|nr:hypothetical protein [Paraburkholderia panacisoli]